MEIETELSAPGLAAGTGRGSFFRTRYIQQGTFVAEDYSMEEVLGSWAVPGSILVWGGRHLGDHYPIWRKSSSGST